MKSKLLIRLSCVIAIFVFFISSGCELPGSSSNNDTTSASGTGGSGGSGGTTGGTGGTQTAGQMNGTWQGTFQETSNNKPGMLGSGILYFTFNQNSFTSFSGGGYFQRSGMPQANLNNFSNGMISGNNISFTVTNGPLSPLGSDTIQYNGILNGNTISGTFERTVITQGNSPAVIKGNFSLTTGGTTIGSTSVNLTGTWQGTYNDTVHSTGMLGNGVIHFNFTQTGNNISGNGLNLTLNGNYVVTSGTVNGNNFNYTLMETSSDNSWSSIITDIATVNGNTMTGTYEATTNFQNPPHTETSKGNFTLNKI
ncbi:MAG: hypothetical protein PHX78_11365 [bacterium]|nr:hypothetical protein [bacterium]